LIKDLKHSHYHDRLEHLGLMCLECLHTRRIRSDYIDTYKIINCIYTVKTELFLIVVKVADEAIQINYFLKKRSRLDIRKFAFSNRIVDRWNSLSECCVTQTVSNIIFRVNWNRKQHEVLQHEVLILWRVGFIA